MTRTVDAAVRIDVEKISYQRVVSIDLSNVDIGKWCLELCLLEQELVNELFLRGPINFRIRINEFPDEVRRTLVSISAKEVALSLHKEELGFCLSYFLQYYRDGAAPVEHIDIEAFVDSTDEEAYITFHVKDYLPPLSPEEARRLIDQHD